MSEGSAAVTPDQAGPAPTFADWLRRIRAATFVGREREIAAVRAALRAPAHPAIFYVWGPGGCGKSALLRRLADEAGEAGREVVRLDGRLIERSPAGVERAAWQARQPGRVLLVDTFEACQGMESWFWDTFLPGLPADCLVVLAGRQAPDPRRGTDAEWSATVRVLPLGDLDRTEAVALLRARGVGEAVTGELYGYAGGHPLALVLAAEVAARGGRPGQWAPHEPAVKTLLDLLVGDLPSPTHRRTLEICAHVLVTREDLLRDVFGERAPELFAWLRDQPYVEAGPDGLRPHDLVRDLLVADLRWRDPDGWRQMHRQVRTYFVERALAATGTDVLPTQLALNYLHRHGDVMARYITWQGRGEVYEDGFRPGDRDALLRMAGQSEGPSGAALVAYWLERRPGGFHVYRSVGTGEPVAYAAWLFLTGPDEAADRIDPLVAAVRAHAAGAGLPRAGARIAVQRFVTVEGAAPTPSPAMDLIYMRGVATCIREPAVDRTYLHMPNPDLWAPVLEYADHRRLTGDLSSVFVHDWLAVPVRPWLDLLQHRLLHGRDRTAGREPLSRAEFDAAVRKLLRTWHHQPSVAGNPLLDTPLGGTAAGLTERTEALRAAVEESVDALRGTRRGDELHRTVATTFFHGRHTRSAAAERLGLPFGTYRHRLAAAVDQVVEELWRRATGSGSVPSR